MKSPYNRIDNFGTGRNRTRFCEGLPLERCREFEVLVTGHVSVL